MNIDYIEIKEKVLVTDEHGKTKEIKAMNNTKDILIQENKVENLKKLILELESEKRRNKEDRRWLYWVGIIITGLLALFSGQLCYLSIGSKDILAVLFYIFATTMFSGYTIVLGLVLKKQHDKLKNIQATLTELKDQYFDEKYYLDVLHFRSLELEQQAVFKITHLEDQQELLKFKKYLLALKELKKKMAKYQRLFEKNELEGYLALHSQDQELNKAIIDVLERKRYKK